MIRTALFDMGNVLVLFSHDRMCQQIGGLCSRTGDDVRRLLLDAGVQWEFERGLLTAEEFHRKFQERVGTRIDFGRLIDAASDIFELNREILPVLDEMKRQGIRLVLLSNTSVWHYEFIRRRFDLLERFDRCILSFEVGAIKPEPTIYERALEVIDCSPKDCFYTDDISAYVEAGRRFGLDAEVFENVPQLKRQLRLRGLQVS